MNRLVVFAHWDPQALVAPATLYHLERLREVATRLHFVSSAPLRPVELAKVAPHCDEAWTRENTGYDFAMWREALARVDLSMWDEVLLTNSSVLGPIAPLGPVLARMDGAAVDYWGMTESVRYTWHLQSWFLVFRRAALAAPAFGEFWRSVLPYRDKFQVVRSYELGLSTWLAEAGLRGAALAPLERVVRHVPLHRRLLGRERDPTLHWPLALLREGVPYVKARLLADNPVKVDLGPVRAAMREAGYPFVPR